MSTLGFAAMEDLFYLFSGYVEQGWGYFFSLFFSPASSSRIEITRH